MGSLCAPAQTTSSYAPNPAATAQYQDILNRANTVASTPYQAYGGQGVAGLTPEQQSGISNVNSAYGTAQPYLNTAAGYAATGAAPVANLSGEDINRYYNPFENDVIKSTMANIGETNAQQQNQLRGNVAARGALGGDREAVMAAELARQQGLASNQTLAGLRSQGFNTALGAATGQQQNQQTNANRAAQAAYSFGNIGNNMQNNATQGGFAQIAAGGVGQQNQQSQLDYERQKFMQAQAFPYQQTGWLAGVSNPTAGAMGGTQTSTPAAPSPFSQIAGAGLTAAMMFAARGGRVHSYAGGGPVSPFNFIDDAGGYVPRVQLAASAPHNFGAPAPMQNPPSMPGGLSGLKGKFAGSDVGYYGGSPESNPNNLMPIGGQTSLGEAGGLGGGLGGLYARGGLVDTIHAIRHSIRRHPYERRSARYADGGTVDLSPADYVNQGFGDIRDADAAGIIDPQGENYGFGQPPPLPLAYARQPEPRVYGANEVSPLDAAAGTGTMPRSPLSAMPSGQPQASPANPLTNGALGPDSAAMPLQGPASDGGAGGASPLTAPTRGGLLGNLTDEQRHGLLAAGLGMLGGSSPYAAVNIGQGGLQGLNAMTALRKEKREAELKQEAQNLRQQHADVEARKLAQQAEQFAKTFGENQSQHRAQQEQRERAFTASKVPPGMMIDPENPGRQTYVPGGIHDPKFIKEQTEAKQRGAGISDEAMDILKQNYRAGNTASVLTSISRGAQGPANIEKFWNSLASDMIAEGANGKDLAAGRANFMSQSAAASVAAKREANVASSVEEARATFPLALEASKGVPRGQFVPYNQLMNMVREKTSSPQQARLAAALQGTMTAYAQAMSRTGVTSVNAQQHAEKLLSAAPSHEALEATLGQMELEMQAALTAPETVRKRILSNISGRGTDEKPPARTTATAAPRVKVSSPEEAARLPKGTPIILPDGREGVVP